jgi:hypothetical protein
LVGQEQKQCRKVASTEKATLIEMGARL